MAGVETFIQEEGERMKLEEKLTERDLVMRKIENVVNKDLGAPTLHIASWLLRHMEGVVKCPYAASLASNILPKESLHVRIRNMYLQLRLNTIDKIQYFIRGQLTMHCHFLILENN